MVTVSHLAAVIMCFLGMVVTACHYFPLASNAHGSFSFASPSQESNIVSGLDLSHGSSQFDAARSSVVGALSITVICIIIGALPLLV
jgi:hypothetical protein